MNFSLCLLLLLTCFAGCGQKEEQTFDQKMQGDRTDQDLAESQSRVAMLSEAEALLALAQKAIPLASSEECSNVIQLSSQAVGAQYSADIPGDRLKIADAKAKLEAFIRSKSSPPGPL